MLKKYPLNSDYEKALRKGNQIFNSLSTIELIPSRIKPFKQYTFGTGAYAIIFKGKINNNIIALRCFQSSTDDIKLRYNEINNYFSKESKPSWYTECIYLDNEILVDNIWFPVLSMNWVEGVTLNNYIDKIINDNEAISKLQSKLITLSNSLERYKTGHGDIQCGNVFINEINNNIKISLVDYDNIYIPKLKELGSQELGQSQFQHPKRTKSDYNHKIDRFSFWVCITALEAIKNDKTLWKKKNNGGFNTGENMLFTREDFNNTKKSKLFNKLILSENASIVQYAQNLIKLCELSSIDSINKPKLLTNLKNDGKYITDKKSKKISTTKLKNDTKKIKSNEKLISTNPPGINILNNKLINIGKTPIVINKNLSENKIIHMSYKGKSVDIIISDYKDNKITIDLESKLPKSKSHQEQINNSSKNTLETLKKDTRDLKKLKEGIKVKRKSKKNISKKIKQKAENNNLKKIEFNVSPLKSSVIINEKGYVSTTSKISKEISENEKVKIIISKENFKTKTLNLNYNSKYPSQISLEKKSDNMGIVIFLSILSFILILTLSISSNDNSNSNSEISSLNNKIQILNGTITSLSDSIIQLNSSSSSLIYNYPIVINNIKWVNSDYNGKELSTWKDSTISRQNLYYLQGKIYFSNKLNNDKDITLFVKYIQPNNVLKKGKSSPKGYSFKTTKTIYPSSTSLKLPGYGNDSGNSYLKGEHTVEIWHNNRIIFSEKLNIY